MLHTLKDLEDFAIHATDGTLGHVKDFYFDDNQWTVRYLIVDTGTWLTSRKILLSPIAIKHINRENKTLDVTLSMEQVKNSPDIDTDKPVSRQHEIDFLSYYGYPNYWDSPGLWGAFPSPYSVPEGYSSKQVESETTLEATEPATPADNHLRSCQDLINYHLQASDGEIGHIQDVFMDADTWEIRYFVVNTSNWWGGHLVLIAPQWITDINWPETKVYVHMTQQQIQNAPLYDPLVPFNRELEKGIHIHYGRDGYWEDKNKF